MLSGMMQRDGTWAHRAICVLTSNEDFHCKNQSIDDKSANATEDSYASQKMRVLFEPDVECM